MSAIMIHVILAILLTYIAILLLHFLVYAFFAIRDDWEIDPDTGEEQPTYYSAYSSLVLKYFWKDVLLEKVMYHPIKSFRILCRFFYTGYLKDKWYWVVDNVWIVNKIYMWNFRRIATKQLNELEKMNSRNENPRQ